MATSTYVRFMAGFALPDEVTPTPGVELVEHLVSTFGRLGLMVQGVDDVQYGHEIRCDVKGKKYKVSVGYDWLLKGWWEIGYSPRLSWFKRLTGQSEEEEMRALTAAIAEALGTLPGVRDARWYDSYAPDSSEFTLAPEY